MELDGSQHADPATVELDRLRTQHLIALGYKVLRVWNVDLKTNMDGVLDQIMAIATSRISPSSAPSRRRRAFGSTGHLLPEGEGNAALSSPGTGEDAQGAGEGLDDELEHNRIADNK